MLVLVQHCVYSGLKSCIFDNDDDLLLSGRTSHQHNHGNLPDRTCAIQPVIREMCRPAQKKSRPIET
jgi:hypothetical protein